METIKLIRNCAVEFETVCPRRWERLAPTETEAVRFCGACAREVFLCETDRDALAHARAGHCIAKPAPDLSGLDLGGLRLGRPVILPRKERLHREEAVRENAKTYALRHIEGSRACPRCDYPYTKGVRTCWVCQARLPRWNPPVTP